MMVKKILVVLSMFFFCIVAQSKNIERIVAIVNDDIITISDLQNYRRKLQTGGLVDESLIDPVQKKKYLSDEKALVDHLIDERVIDSEVKKQSLSVTIEKVE